MGCGKSKVKKLTEDNEKVLESNHFNSTEAVAATTFDDSVNDLNRDLYKEIFKDYRLNPNGCPISATFYVSHEWTDYSQVQNLYASGHEIASHSIS